jgi:hypothetical protein
MDTVRKTVMFEDTDLVIGAIEIISPTTQNVTDYIQGKTVVTPTGHKITQVMYNGNKLTLSWNGMLHEDFMKLKNLIDACGYCEMYYTSVAPNGDLAQYKVVIDGTTKLDYKIRYNVLLKKIRYNVTLKLITVP